MMTAVRCIMSTWPAEEEKKKQKTETSKCIKSHILLLMVTFTLMFSTQTFRD